MVSSGSFWGSNVVASCGMFLTELVRCGAVGTTSASSDSLSGSGWGSDVAGSGNLLTESVRFGGIGTTVVSSGSFSGSDGGIVVSLLVDSVLCGSGGPVSPTPSCGGVVDFGSVLAELVR